MPAVAREAGFGGFVTLEARGWNQHDNRSIISPTTLAFLIPVLIVFFSAPFLCVFCIRRRQGDRPIRRNGVVKLPALQRSEARERLELVTEILSVTGSNEKTASVDKFEEKSRSDSVSMREKECAICLSTLRAPSPPEPAKLTNDDGAVNEATIAPPRLVVEQEEILRLKECGHEYHAECLVSWVVLHKKSCPICRTVYYHGEPEKPTDVEAQTRAGVSEEPVGAEPASNTQPPVSNWHYFWTGREVRQEHTQPGVRSIWQQFRRFRS